MTCVLILFTPIAANVALVLVGLVRHVHRAAAADARPTSPGPGRWVPPPPSVHPSPLTPVARIASPVPIVVAAHEPSPRPTPAPAAAVVGGDVHA